jgi:DNA-binding MarR family transcriptional regulator
MDGCQSSRCQSNHLYLSHYGMKNAHYTIDNFTGPDCIGYLISQAQAKMRPRVEALFEREDISFTQWRALMCLRDNLANTCADISRELSHDKGSMTRVIDLLEERGLIQRRRDAGDRRVVFLALTPAGRSALSALTPKIVAYFNTLLGDFSVDEVRLLTGLLKKLNGALQSENAQEREGIRA